MRRKLAVAAAAFGILSLMAPAHSVETCYLKNAGKTKAIVRIIDESTGAERIVHLNPKQRTRVQAENGRIRYEYYYPDQESEFHSSTDAGCERRREIAL